MSTGLATHEALPLAGTRNGFCAVNFPKKLESLLAGNLLACAIASISNNSNASKLSPRARLPSGTKHKVATQRPSLQLGYIEHAGPINAIRSPSNSPHDIKVSSQPGLVPLALSFSNRAPRAVGLLCPSEKTHNDALGRH
jgi:hypothetical protein